MKKFLIGGLLATVLAAQAADFSVNSVRDVTTDKYGLTVSATGGKYGFVNPTVSVTDITGAFTRYTAGAEANVAKFGFVDVKGTANVSYQVSAVGENGLGAAYGFKAVSPLARNVEAVLGVERFTGDHRITQNNGNLVSVGVSYKF